MLFGQVKYFTYMNQSGLIYFKFLFLEEFSILLSQVKELSHFWYGPEVNRFLSYKRSLHQVTESKVETLIKLGSLFKEA